MANGIARAELYCDGEKIPGVVSVEDTEVEHGTRQATLDGSMYSEVVPEYGVNIEYAVPKTGRFDFLKFKQSPGTLIVYYFGGTKRTYFGIQPLKESASKIDGKASKMETWEMMATDRKDG